MQIQVYGGNAPEGVAFGDAGGTILNDGDVVVYFDDNPDVSTSSYTGTLVPGGSDTLSGTWFFTIPRSSWKTQLEIQLFERQFGNVTINTGIPHGVGAPQGTNRIGLYAGDVAGTTSVILYFDGNPILTDNGTVGTLQTVLLGDVSYDFRHADNGKTIQLQPATSRTVSFHTFLFEQALAGDTVQFACLGPGSIVFAADLGATVNTLPRAIGPGEQATAVCTAASTFAIVGGHIDATVAQTPISLSSPTIVSNGTVFSVNSNGIWAPSAGTTFTYQWIREATINAEDWAPLGGETASTHTIVSGDRAHRVRVRVTAHNSGLDSAYSESGSLVAPVSGQPINTVAPKFTMPDGSAILNNNTVEVGTAVIVNGGTWSPAATSYSVEIWNRNGAGGEVSRGVDTTAPFDYTTVTGDQNEVVYANVTATNASGTAPVISTPTFNVVPVGALTPGGPPGTTRDAALWPFASASPWNTPIGTAANFSAGDARTTAIRAPSVNINSSYYSIPVTQAVAGNPTITMVDTKSGTGTHTFAAPSGAIQIANGFDQHSVTINAAKSQADEAWLTAKTDNTHYTCGFFAHININESGTGFGSGVRAAFFSVLGGLIRQWEVAAGSINHALVIGIPQAQAKRGFVWPAVSEDGGNNYAGNIPLGTLFAIPNSVNVNGLAISASGKIIAHALQNFGGYVGDTTTSVATLCAEPSLEGSSWLTAARSDANAIFDQLVVVTNSTPSTIGGGGTYINNLSRPPLAA